MQDRSRRRPSPATSRRARPTPQSRCPPFAFVTLHELMIRLPETRDRTGRQHQRRSPSPRQRGAHGEPPFRLAQTRGIDGRAQGRAPARRPAHAAGQSHPCELGDLHGTRHSACARPHLWTRAASLGCALPRPSGPRFRAARARRCATCHQAAADSALPDRPERRSERRVSGRRSPLPSALVDISGDHAGHSSEALQERPHRLVLTRAQTLPQRGPPLHFSLNVGL